MSYPRLKQKTDDDSLADDVTSFTNHSPNKRRAIDRVEPGWFKENGNWNTYINAPWTHPTTGTKYIDVFILLPSSIDHNSQYSINVQPDGLSIKLNLVWPTHFANLETLTKIARSNNPEVSSMHPLVGGITSAFKDLKLSIHDDISQIISFLFLRKFKQI